MNKLTIFVVFWLININLKLKDFSCFWCWLPQEHLAHELNRPQRLAYFRLLLCLVLVFGNFDSEVLALLEQDRLGVQLLAAA